MRETIKVLICDDHPAFRELVRMILGKEPLVEVVGEAEDGKQGLDKALSMRPDVVLMDLNMPALNGIEATRRIVGADKRIRIVILTMDFDPLTVHRCREAGASGYVLKDRVGSHLVKAIQVVNSGRSYFVRASAKSA